MLKDSEASNFRHELRAMRQIFEAADIYAGNVRGALQEEIIDVLCAHLGVRMTVEITRKEQWESLANGDVPPIISTTARQVRKLIRESGGRAS